jgi:2-amino-4-hydroxy-6-hydroxymethyldihydropteridine diphosphokinase
VDHRIFIGIGSNIGNSQENCLTSIKYISKDDRATCISSSSFYLTSPVSEIKQDDFINCAVSLEWEGTPLELLSLLQRIETTMGRTRATVKGPRIIDLDILLFSDHIINSPYLVTPHPELHRRKFAIIPCLEIEPEIIHPAYNKPLKDFLSGIDDTQKITKITGDTMMRTLNSIDKKYLCG